MCTNITDLSLIRADLCLNCISGYIHEPCDDDVTRQYELLECYPFDTMH